MDNIEKDIAQGYADFADDEGSIEEVETEENIVTENSTSFSFEETTNFSEMSDINRKLRTYFDGKIVRKDLTKSIKEGANVPVYVLEFLLGQYCSSDDPSIIEEGVANVKEYWQTIMYDQTKHRKSFHCSVRGEVIPLLIRLRSI